ncbi:putative histidine kinase-like ATPase domain-containing protein [Rosa chinensis]|uniref:Putative histidine kinase-like ATPase domain-containing protein n=1 Tax=Rosa chinensis TaxID=74649 RepID=A0A2P6RID0_ROSCH|nr:putative histidine kinase-like ATPase domain-containing protein [Rosa chinensis]
MEGESSSDWTQKEEAAKLHIEEIRTQKYSIGKDEANPLGKDLHRALMTNISKDANFLRELILNAEENEYEEGVLPEMKFVLTKEDITETGAPATLLVFNNEVGFSRENMDSICGIGSGFKSVFLVSSQPYIFSNGYRVRFQEEPDQDCGIGYIVPQWVSGHPSISSIYDVYGLSNAYPATTVILPLKPEMVEAVREQLSQLCPEIILFLSKLKQLSVRDYDSEVADRVSSFLISSVTKNKEVSSRVVQLSKKNLDDTEELCDYYLWEKEFPVKPENRFGVRMDVQSWVITIAFPSGERMRNATSSVGIFAFLPTTMVTDFPFLIQADFILNSSRDSILLENVWNLGILNCIPSAFVNAFHSPDDPLLSDLTNSIAGRRCLKTSDWTDPFKTPEESILFDPAWESILDRTMLPTIDENFYGTDILVYKSQLRDIGVKVDPLSVCSLLYGIFSKLHGTYFENTFIKSIYTFLNKFQWHPEEPDGTEIFIDTDDYDWVNPDHCVLHGDPNLRRNT